MADRPAQGSSLDSALAWLDGVVSNTGHPYEDAGVWMLTHESWRSEIVRAYPGSPVGAGSEADVTTFDDWQAMARWTLLQLRDALPMALRRAGGAVIGVTQIAVPLSVDSVQVVFSDENLAPGDYVVPAGTRIGFALNAVYNVDVGWAIAGFEPDWCMPAWLADLLTPGGRRARI